MPRATVPPSPQRNKPKSLHINFEIPSED
jgi:hypothetical protein